MESLQAIINQIKNFCDTRGVDIESELFYYDRKGRGIISEVALQQWIGTLGIRLKPEQLRALADQFHRGEGVDWRRLQNAIENSTNPKEPTSAAHPPHQCIGELKKLAGMLSVKQQTLRDFLHPYDVTNHGKVTIEQFYRAFGATSTTKSIVKYYADTVTGYIDYIKMQNDIQSIETQKIDPDSPITELPDCFEYLARYIKSRSIDIFRIFRHADSTNTGKLNEAHFISALSSIQAPVTPIDIRDISCIFLDDFGTCNYRQFIATVEAFKPRPSEAVVSATIKSEQAQVKIDTDELLEEIKANIKQRRINVNTFFEAARVDGYEDVAPIRMFGQILMSMHLSLQSDEIVALADLFRSKQRGMVDYSAFIKAVTPQVSSQTISSTDVISKLRKQLAELHKSFGRSASRYDREGSGEISCNQFISALQFVGVEITGQEVSLIYPNYQGRAYGSIAWKELARDIDPEETTQRRVTEEYQEDEHELHATPPPAVNNILLTIQNAAQRFNIDVERVFSSYDRRHRGSICNADFYDAVNSLGVNINQGDIKVLASFYRISGSPEIRYRNFVEDIKTAKPIVEEQKEVYHTNVVTLPSIPLSVHNFIKRFKLFAQMHRFTVTDIFEPYDNSKNGTVQIARVPPAFNNIQFASNRNELEDLIATFRDQRKRELFNYLLFQKAVNEEDISSQEARSELSGEPISPEVNREVLTTCLQIHERLISRRRRPDFIFAGIQSETIPINELQRRLYDAGINLRAGQMSSIFRKYRVGITEEIRWHDFCRDIENSRTIGEF